MDERPEIKDSEIYFVVACLALGTTTAITFILEAGFRDPIIARVIPLSGWPVFIVVAMFGLTVLAGIVLAFDREPGEPRADPNELFGRLPRELPWLATLCRVCASLVVVALALSVASCALR